MIVFVNSSPLIFVLCDLVKVLVENILSANKALYHL